MKKINYLLYICLLVTTACSNNTTDLPKKSAETTESTASNYPYVIAKINGNNWQSDKDEILATYNDFEDKLNIYTKDANGKMNFLITLASFSKTGVGSYNSVREGAGGFGISLLDDDKKDNVENDYDNFHQAAVLNCITVSSIKEVAEGKIVEGTFTSPMNVSNNYDANKDKGVVVTDGKFAVLVKK
jgi:hypothetical protein